MCRPMINFELNNFPQIVHGNFDSVWHSFECCELYGSPTDLWFWSKHAATASTTPKKKEEKENNQRNAPVHGVLWITPSVIPKDRR